MHNKTITFRKTCMSTTPENCRIKHVEFNVGFPGGRRFHFTDADGYELAVWTQV